jgi:hypothetical protein
MHSTRITGSASSREDTFVVVVVVVVGVVPRSFGSVTMTMAMAIALIVRAATFVLVILIVVVVIVVVVVVVVVVDVTAHVRRRAYSLRLRIAQQPQQRRGSCRVCDFSPVLDECGLFLLPLLLPPSLFLPEVSPRRAEHRPLGLFELPGAGVISQCACHQPPLPLLLPLPLPLLLLLLPLLLLLLSPLLTGMRLMPNVVRARQGS